MTEQMESEKQLAEALGDQRLQLRELIKRAGVSKVEMADILDYLRDDAGTLNTARVRSARTAVERLVEALACNAGVVDDETAQALTTLNQKLQEAING
jgi:hypothetical protein